MSAPDMHTAHVAAVVRASSAGPAGTSREQIAEALTQWESGVALLHGYPSDRVREAAVLLNAAAKRLRLALRPDPAPDDTADLRAEAERRIDTWRRGLAVTVAERDAARADLAALREAAKEAEGILFAATQTAWTQEVRDQLLWDGLTKVRALLGGKP